MKVLYFFCPFLFFSLFACQKEKHPPFSQVPIYQENIAGFEALKDSLRAICQNPKGQMGIYVYDAQLDKSFSIAGDTLFPLASVYKLPIVASLLAAQEAGKPLPLRFYSPQPRRSPPLRLFYGLGYYGQN